MKTYRAIIEAAKDPRTVLGKIKLSQGEMELFWSALGNVASAADDKHIEDMGMLKRNMIHVTPTVKKLISKALKGADSDQVTVLKKVKAAIK
jgi:hypothetical protein